MRSPVHGAHIQIVGDVPFILGGIENGAVMHNAGTVEQDVGLCPGNAVNHRAALENIQREGGNSVRPVQRSQCFLIDVGGEDLRAFCCHRQCRGPAYALAGGRYQRRFSSKSSCLCHVTHQ